MFAREIGSYWIMDKIGESRIGTVYKGMHRSRDEEVAVTLVKPEVLSQFGREAFLSRVELLKRLSHRNVVKVVDCVADGDDVFLLADLVPGETLAEKLGREGALGIDGVREIFLPVLAAAQYMHGKKVMHGDLHADQIVVGPDGVVQVAGFGMAFFSPPPRHEGQGMTVDADLLAVGAILSASLSGVRAGRPREDGSQQPPADMPALVQKVVERAISGDAQKRYRTAKEFARDLAAACGGRTWPVLPQLSTLAWLALLLVMLPLAAALLLRKPQAPISQQKKMALVPEKMHTATAAKEHGSAAPPHVAEQPLPGGPHAVTPTVVSPPAGDSSAGAPTASGGPASGESAAKGLNVATKSAGGSVASPPEAHQRKEHHQKRRIAKAHSRKVKPQHGVPPRTIPAYRVVPAAIEKERWQIRK